MGKNLARLLKQHRKSMRVFFRSKQDRFFSLLSLSALGISVGMLMLVLCSIVNNGYKALTATKILLHLDDTESIRKDSEYFREDCIKRIHSALDKILSSHVDLNNPETKRIAYGIVSETAHYELADLIQKNVRISPDGLWLNASTEFLSGAKNNEISGVVLKTFEDQERIKRSFFNKSLFTNSHSKVPENAGILGALIGSLLTIIVCLAIAIPLGIMTGICMQELLSNNKVSSIIEISINNLSSVPSIIFGVLGLVVYLNIFGVPRSSSLAGGMTLSIMILPYLILTTRQALAAVPESVKHAALSLGATNMQVIMHHSLPIAFPALVQGVLVSVARIIGESSPLIMIGMVAFVIDLPKTFLDPASVLPVQIYIWANNSSAEFTKISAIAILALLMILLVLNMIAAFIKRRLDNFSF
ncbi:phosphate ABC transporter permease [Anaplasma phagocytophilum str. Norway variant2]|uniref:Phosphate transport system permease protein PstA n=1 Tax=Anaplasma phagocytophilum str. Norway variant2 TaxID=1392507 RepID=A0A168H7E8_ANAPH|nr:phosphate ABC transporter permease PstA [Anaplasma phagocytophilum]ANC34094.1 phosphate ABC transporter permease [Anaplasma phagocytophilum str. Norway variant2]